MSSGLRNVGYRPQNLRTRPTAIAGGAAFLGMRIAGVWLGTSSFLESPSSSRKGSGDGVVCNVELDKTGLVSVGDRELARLDRVEVSSPMSTRQRPSIIRDRARSSKAISRTPSSSICIRISSSSSSSSSSSGTLRHQRNGAVHSRRAEFYKHISYADRPAICKGVPARTASSRRSKLTASNGQHHITSRRHG